MKLTCADPACERAQVRERDGKRWCLYHPDVPAPDMDMVSGKLRGPDGKPKRGSIALEPARPRRRQAAKPSTPPAPRRGPARRPVTSVDLPPDRRPTPADVADAYDQAAELVEQVAGVAVDEAEAARRYLAGEPLFALAADLQIGAVRLRRILTDQGVQIRARGEILGRRGAAPRPIDEDECERLYREGLNSGDLARRLGVTQRRVTAVLRARGVLRAMPGTFRPIDVDEARRLYATGLTVAQVARSLGVRAIRVADVLRELGELRPQGHNGKAV